MLFRSPTDGGHRTPQFMTISAVDRFDVVVLGAGPGGAAITHSLVRRGLSVALVDPRLGHSWHQTLGSWVDDLDPCDDSIVLKGLARATWPIVRGDQQAACPRPGFVKAMIAEPPVAPREPPSERRPRLRARRSQPCERSAPRFPPLRRERDARCGQAPGISIRRSRPPSTAASSTGISFERPSLSIRHGDVWPRSARPEE